MKHIGYKSFGDNNHPAYFCKKLSSLLSADPSDALIVALDATGDPSIEIERRRLLLIARTTSRQHHDLHRAFPPTLFRNANWSIMLTCFIALLEGRTECVKQIQSLLEDSHTAVLRHIDALEAHQLVGRQRDPIDGRRTLVLLTGHGAIATARYLNGFTNTLTGSVSV
jgi:hypothetical protein